MFGAHVGIQTHALNVQPVSRHVQYAENLENLFIYIFEELYYSKKIAFEKNN